MRPPAHGWGVPDFCKCDCGPSVRNHAARSGTGLSSAIMVGTDEQRQRQRGDRRQNATQREVLEDMKSAVKACQVFGEG